MLLSTRYGVSLLFITVLHCSFSANENTTGSVRVLNTTSNNATVRRNSTNGIVQFKSVTNVTDDAITTNHTTEISIPKVGLVNSVTNAANITNNNTNSSKKIKLASKVRYRNERRNHNLVVMYDEKDQPSALRSRIRKKKKNEAIQMLWYQEYDESNGSKLVNELKMYKLEDVLQFFQIYLDTPPEVCYGKCVAPEYKE